MRAKAGVCRSGAAPKPPIGCKVLQIPEQMLILVLTAGISSSVRVPVLTQCYICPQKRGAGQSLPMGQVARFAGHAQRSHVECGEWGGGSDVSGSTHIDGLTQRRHSHQQSRPLDVAACTFRCGVRSIHIAGCREGVRPSQYSALIICLSTPTAGQGPLP